jgi:hypothetical protein
MGLLTVFATRRLEIGMTTVSTTKHNTSTERRWRLLLALPESQDGVPTSVPPKYVVPCTIGSIGVPEQWGSLLEAAPSTARRVAS